MYNLNRTCFLFVRSQLAARLIAMHIPHAVLRVGCLMLAAGFLSALLQLCALLMVVCRPSVVLALAIAVRLSSAVVMHSSRN